jgi:hypothetical protein
MVATDGSNQIPKVSKSKLYFNATLGELSATDFNTLSDFNKKTNIYTIENSMLGLQKIRGVNFDWKETGKKNIGVIAQEVEAVYPELVKTNVRGEKTVAYNGLIAVLIEAIKDQQYQIDQLKTTIKEQKWLH